MDRSTRDSSGARRLCLGILALMLAGGLTALILLDPIPQDPGYHDFADQRDWLGVPRFGDVATNAPFIVIGAAGLWLVTFGRAADAAFERSRERAAYAVFFAGVLLTGFGSGWYHLLPGNSRLVWDRLPMTLGFMGIFSALISERFHPRAGVALLAPLVAAGVASVAWWAWTEEAGRGDLRWYGLVQFYPLAAAVLMLALLRSRYTRGSDYWAVLLWYVAAKVAEIFDREIFDAGELVSGHSLKHLLAAAGAWWVLRMLRLRRPLP